MNTLAILKEALCTKECECGEVVGSMISVYPYNNNLEKKQLPYIEVTDFIGQLGKVQLDVVVAINTKVDNITDVFCCLNNINEFEYEGLKFSFELNSLTQDNAIGNYLYYQGTAYQTLRR